MKKCGSCKQQKPFADFHKSSRSKDGHNGWCKQCAANNHVKYRPLRLKQLVRNSSIWQCRMCERMLSIADYHSYNSTYCKECLALYNTRRNIQRYGITLEQYMDMLRKQNFVCAICKQPEKSNSRLAVDHDHSCCTAAPRRIACGKCVRGLLCTRCNKALGMLADDRELLLKMIDYLA